MIKKLTLANKLIIQLENISPLSILSSVSVAVYLQTGVMPNYSLQLSTPGLIMKISVRIVVIWSS